MVHGHIIWAISKLATRSALSFFTAVLKCNKHTLFSVLTALLKMEYDFFAFLQIYTRIIAKSLISCKIEYDFP